MSEFDYFPATIEQLNAMSVTDTLHAILLFMMITSALWFGIFVFKILFDFLIWFMPKFWHRLKK